MHDVKPVDFSRIAQDLQIRKVHVETVAALLDEGNTPPFIARFRKDQIGELSEDVIRQIKTRVHRLRQLAERKQTIIKSIEAQGKLSAELRDALQHADTPRRLDDLYAAFKPKKKTPGVIARERGLEPAALAIWNGDPAVGNLDELWPTLVNPDKELPTVEDVKAGVRQILAEIVAETADVRGAVRSLMWESGKLVSVKNEQFPANEAAEFRDYFQFSEQARQIPAHRILALNRGEKAGALKVTFERDTDAIHQAALHMTAEAALRARGAAATPAPSSEPAPLAVSLDQPVFVGASFSPMSAAPASALPPPMEGELLSPHSSFKSPHTAFLKEAVDEALQRVLLPLMEREIRQELRDEAEEHAVAVFAKNLRSLLLQPPLRGKRVLAIDPGFRAGCRVAALDENGNLLEETTIHPHPPKKGREAAEKKVETPEAPSIPTSAAEAITVSPWSASSFPVVFSDPTAAPPAPAETPPVEEKTPPVDRRQEAKTKLQELISKHQIAIVAIGNGGGSRETEEIVAELIEGGLDVSYAIVNEAGASAYSISPLGRDEFPNIDSSLRATIAIGRRLQDPLAELVKVDPQNIGVGLYQHDVKRRELRESLDAIVESCVNQVGADLNKADAPLLKHISGLNAVVARDIVEHRKQHGPFASREQLLQVPSMSPQRYAQAAGFLKVSGSSQPLDRTWIHPESYAITEKILGELGFTPSIVDEPARNEELRAKLRAVNLEETSARLGIGPIALDDVFYALAKPGEDPRDELPPPILKKKMLKFEDLQPGMELKGTVLNVVDFGAFVDIGLKESGLVHISQMANRFIKSPYDVVVVGDVVTLWVLNVDKDRHRVSLTMIRPGSERPPEERKLERSAREASRPPRGRHPRGPAEHRGEPRPPRVPRPEPRQQPGSESRETSAAKPPPPRPAPPPRRPRRDVPKPKLSAEALEGKVPLRTFGELSALFAAKTAPPPKHEPEPVKAEPVPAAAAAEAPPAEPVAAAVEPAPVESPSEKPAEPPVPSPES